MKNFLTREIDSIISAARRARLGSIQDRQQLRYLVEARSPEHLRELIATMWLGRGFGGESISDWADLLENAFGLDPEYVCLGASLADYLEAGRQKISAAVN